MAAKPPDYRRMIRSDLGCIVMEVQSLEILRLQLAEEGDVCHASRSFVAHALDSLHDAHDSLRKAMEHLPEPEQDGAFLKLATAILYGGDRIDRKAW